MKHNDAKSAIQNSKKRDQSLLTFLRRKDEEDNPKGETLPEDMRLFRFDLVEAFLSAGIPLSKIDHLRSFLKKYGHRLTALSAHGHLSQMIPSIIEKEKSKNRTLTRRRLLSHFRWEYKARRSSCNRCAFC